MSRRMQGPARGGCWLSALMLCLAFGSGFACKGFEGAPKPDGGQDGLGAAGAGGGAPPATGNGGAVDGAGGAVTGGGTTGTGGAATGIGGAPGSCGATQHSCAGTCVANNSIDHCGPQCDPCKPPAGAIATCDGTACGFTCGSGTKKCAATSICVPTAGCCSDADCTAQAGSCDSGTHMCSSGCGANTKSCTVGGATSCIPSGGCCQDSDCMGNCQTCSAATHTCVAALNRDDPNGRCAGTCDAAGACKSKRGQTCATTAGGCLAGSTCSPEGTCCDTACSGPCQACDLPGKAGTCSPVASGQPRAPRATCNGYGTPCGGACANRADGACVYPTGTCGNSPMCGSNGFLAPGTCSAGDCIPATRTPCPNGCNATNDACLVCAAGETPCTRACSTLINDPKNCGMCGMSCPYPSSGVAESVVAIFGAPTCSNSTCGWTCTTNFTKCPGTTPLCSRSRWDFEDGSTQGHRLRTDLGSTYALTSVGTSTAQAHGGTYSMALDVRSGGGLVETDFFLCDYQGSPLSIANRSTGAWVFIEASALDPNKQSTLSIGMRGCLPSGADCPVGNVPISFTTAQLNKWQYISSTPTASYAAANPNVLGLTLYGNLYPVGTAVIYVDDMTWQ